MWASEDIFYIFQKSVFPEPSLIRPTICLRPNQAFRADPARPFSDWPTLQKSKSVVEQRIDS